VGTPITNAIEVILDDVNLLFMLTVISWKQFLLQHHDFKSHCYDIKMCHSPS
jgi:hypothetical protein